MKILVFSDSHGDSDVLEGVIAEEEVNTDLIIHLGDGVRDIEYTSLRHSMLPVITVNGNFESYGDDTKVFEEGGIKIMCTHGHAYGVKGGVGRLAEEAYTRGADLVLYGHTHIPYNNTFELQGKSIKVFNPGSVGRGFPPCYGIIKIDGEVIRAEHKTL